MDSPESSESQEDISNISEGDIKVGQSVNDWGKISGPEECARECIGGEQPKICYYDWIVEYYRTLGG